jgi:hypothetical protein
MKSRETLVRLKRFQVDDRRRQVAQIEGMIAEFERMAADLDRLRLVLDRLLGLLAQDIERAIARDRDHPGDRRRQPRVEVPRAAPDFQIGFLHDFVRQIGPTQDTQHDAVKFRAGRIIEALEGLLVPLCDRRQQPNKFHRRRHDARSSPSSRGAS